MLLISLSKTFRLAYNFSGHIVDFLTPIINLCPRGGEETLRTRVIRGQLLPRGSLLLSLALNGLLISGAYGYPSLHHKHNRLLLI